MSELSPQQKAAQTRKANKAKADADAAMAELVKGDEPKANTGLIKVKAKASGFYGCSIRNIGDVFDIESESELGSWMDKV